MTSSIGIFLLQVLILHFFGNIFVNYVADCIPLPTPPGESPPDVRVIVRVRQRRHRYWDFWALNSSKYSFIHILYGISLLIVTTRRFSTMEMVRIIRK